MVKESVFTTYQVGQYCSVEMQTVIDWVNRGKLPAFKTPGGHRRIIKKDLINFLKKYNMPIHPELLKDGKKKNL